MNYQKTSTNNFDNLVIDVKKLYKDHPLNSFDNPSKSLFTNFYNNILPLSLRSFVWYVFHRINLDEEWFFDFKKYWKYVLGGITLWGPQDFYFLRNIYRLKFRNSSLSAKGGAVSHLKSWQKPEILYQLLDMVYRESLFNQVEAIKLYKKFNKSKNKDIYEFGCGTAPVTSSFVDFENIENRKIYISDLETIFFHYAAFRFRGNKSIVPIPLLAKDQFKPKIPGKVGAVFCMTVFEHLEEPLMIAKLLTGLIEKNGVLIFDYIKTDGKGMDSKKSLSERNKVIDCIKSNYKIVYGKFDDSNEAKTIVALKQ